MKNKLKTLGAQITIISCSASTIIAIIVAVLVAVLFANNIRTSEYNSTDVAIDVIESEINSETLILKRISDNLIVKGIDNWDNIKTSNYDFAAIIHNSDVKWKTDNFNLSKYEDNLNGVYVDNNRFLCVYSTRMDNGDLLIVGSDLADTTYVDNIKNSTNLEVTFIVNDTRYSTTLLNDNNERNINTKIDNSVLSKLKTNTIVKDRIKIGSKEYFVNYTPIFYNNNYVGAYFVGHSADQYFSELRTTILIGLGCILCLTIIVAAILLFTFKKIVTKPMSKLTPIVENLHNGNLSYVPFGDKLPNNEIGTLYTQISDAINILRSYINDINYILSQMADGDFTVTSNVSYVGDFVTIGQSIETIKTNLTNILQNITTVAEQVNQGSIQLATGSELLANNTQTQASASDTLLTTINYISEDFIKTTENASNASEESKQCADLMNEQLTCMRTLVDAMDKIDTKSHEVAEIAKGIEDLAFQTNILALNASIEAARVGVAGKGFAVVADEIGNLAAKSAESSANTRAIIESTINAIQESVQSAKNAAAAIENATEISNSMTEHIHTIAEDISIQSTRLKESILSIDSINESIQSNSANAEESAASCEELTSQASMLNSELDKFKIA